MSDSTRMVASVKMSRDDPGTRRVLHKPIMLCFSLPSKDLEFCSHQESGGQVRVVGGQGEGVGPAKVREMKNTGSELDGELLVARPCK